MASPDTSQQSDFHVLLQICFKMIEVSYRGKVILITKNEFIKFLRYKLGFRFFPFFTHLAARSRYFFKFHLSMIYSAI